eukprot:TRINITY_DN15459_c0_g1_i3.p2 TRINITY_DN15459_c0_g1~~TRINITY_DN15459_c0_g1_i3.p2  ORF type:complete len:137 (+),score=22.57 TRINITY_DN15459_c0_g1_i3:768-1178(+)
MWVPLPANMLPFVAGLFFTNQEIHWKDFFIAAIPSKWIHFSCIIVIGMEASSLSDALSHSEGSGADGSWMKLLAVTASLVCTVGMLGYIILVMKREVAKMKIDGLSAAVDLESGARGLQSPWNKVFSNPYARDIPP